MPESPYNVRDALDVPSLVSLSRVALAIAFPFAVQLPGVALSIVALAAASDMLDGYCARKLGRMTPTGAALDPLVDKIFAASVVISMLATGRLPVGWAVLLCTRELVELPLLIALLFVPRARFARLKHMKANWPGKLTTVLQFVALGTALFNLPYLPSWSVLTAAVGFIAATLYWASFSRALRAETTV